jgi:hypothetical protein
MGFWPVVLNILKNSDVILLLVDARMPEITRNSEIIKKVHGMNKELLIIFNKIDLIGGKELKKLRTSYGDSFFVSSSRKTGVKELKKYLEDYAEEWRRSSLRIGIVGYPNIGKSTLINLLAPRAGAKVSRISGTTKKTGWYRVGKIRYLDSPGVIPFGDRKVQIGMTASKDPHKIKNPDKVAMRIIDYLDKKGGNILKRFYGVGNLKGQKMFDAIGDKKKYRLKGGGIDENRTAIRIISDWQDGKIKLK